ncbi:MAG TPA: arsenosugar biosynthesis radical SAM (seleno)protein ArsS [Abditibacteriaceae bacterium]|nr:arsenosugar biosynthesis radical SAM (seleno)protein ArsS [Abditibacteriaceae bacterium]
MSNRFEQILQQHNLSLRRRAPQVLQLNVGRRCNQTCAHCHVNAGPARTEIMTRPTMERVLQWLARTLIPTVDITGGAPELNPNFRYLVTQAKALEPPRHVMDRCNLTVLFQPGQEDLADFLARYGVEIVASLPCYLEENVAAQRGDGVFEPSIRALQLLNKLGYGSDPRLPLHLVYNPLGASLPGPQAELEAVYKAELQQRFGIIFNRLYTITNMPIARFAAMLRRAGEAASYQELLMNAFNPHAVDGLMCRTTLNIGWRGEVYDCDFNQMLDFAWHNGRPYFLWEIEAAQLEQRPISTGDHCFGCTAGAGSSCSGAVVPTHDTLGAAS